jgi:hypothetical protein
MPGTEDIKELSDEDMKSQEEITKKLQEKYEVRNFKTTSESLIFTKKMAKAMSGMKLDLKEIKDVDISAVFDFFDPDLVKYTVDTFIMEKTASGLKSVNYEEDFIGDFQIIMSLFLMAVQHLSGKVNGRKKPQAPKVEKKQKKIKSTKRLLD